MIKKFDLTGISKQHVFKSIMLIMLAISGINSAYAVENLEKEELKFGFIKLTDMAPLAIAYEKHFFEDEGLYVTLEPQANWKVLLDRVIDGELDGATWNSTGRVPSGAPG